jgi:hypothetical protein
VRAPRAAGERSGKVGPRTRARVGAPPQRRFENVQIYAFAYVVGVGEDTHHESRFRRH